MLLRSVLGKLIILCHILKKHQNLIYDSPGGLLATPDRRPKQILAITTNMTWFSSTAEIANAINSLINAINSLIKCLSVID